MTNRLVTVFGGSGFAGRYFVKRLAATGARIRIAVRRPDKAMFLKPMGKVGQIMPIQANLRDDRSVEAAVAGADDVVNLVGILAQKGRQKFDALHADGAARIARFAKAEGVDRLVHVSSLGAAEDGPSRYLRSKAVGERELLKAFPSATIIRSSVMFGQEDQFFNRFAFLLRMMPVFPLLNGGQSKLQPVYVGDVADVIMAVLDDPSTRGQVLEVGGPQVMTLQEILQFVADTTDRARLFVPQPYPLSLIMGALLGLLPAGLVTADQVRSLTVDNVVVGENALDTFGIQAQTVGAIVPTYLARYRRSGEFATG